MEEALLDKAGAIRAAAVTRRIGQHDPMAGIDAASLPVIEVPFRMRRLKVRCTIDELPEGRLKHIVVEFAGNPGNAVEDPLNLLYAALDVALAVEPESPGFYGTSHENGRQLGHVFWPVDWRQADIAMPPGPGPYWANPFQIARNGESCSLKLNKEFTGRLELVSADALQRHISTAGLLTLVLQYLDRQQNWDLLLLTRADLWPAYWPTSFKNLLASAGNHRLWECRACGANHVPDAPLTRDLLDIVVDESRHGNLPVALLPGFSTSSAACWPISESLLFCQIEYVCPACQGKFDRKLFVETLPPEEGVPDLAATDTGLHRCPGLQVNNLPGPNAGAAGREETTTEPTFDKKLSGLTSNFPGKEQFDAHNDLNTWDVDGLLSALESGDRTRKLVAIEKLAWSLYGDESSRAETALVNALRDNDSYVAIRAAKTFLAEGRPGYLEQVVEATQDSSIDEDIRQSIKAMISMCDELQKK
ncbi:MAG: hypothetical protein ACE5FQ_07750 [Thiogranum sp.]